MKVVLKFKINQYNVILELVRFQFDFIMLCLKKNGFAQKHTATSSHTIK